MSFQQKANDEQKMYDENKGVIQRLDTLQLEIQGLENKISEKKQVLEGKRTQLVDIKSSLKELEEDILKKDEHHRNSQVFQEMQNWLDQCFVPVIEDIEKYVLRNIQEEFNQLFQRWFNILMEMGNVSVEIDESFTPKITQGGYSLGIDSLSGGEKTSSALAYRLALNTMIKKAADMENNLIILDEPTDGFGKEQLIRLRRVLDELESAQIIMVSHERELESFVDTIYRITKEGSTSRIESLT